MPTCLARGIIFQLVKVEPLDVLDCMHESIINSPLQTAKESIRNIAFSEVCW